MRNLTINILKHLLSVISPGEEWKSNNLNYKSIVMAINSQSAKGKIALFKTLALNLSREDRKVLREILANKRESKK